MEGITVPVTMDIDKLAEIVANNTKGSKVSDVSVFKRGKKYFIRTVTHYFTGTVVDITDKELVIVDACWIADTGRYSEALSKGEFAEMEPYPDGLRVILNRESFIDASEWHHDLPRTMK